jgi:hypothetical protein
MSNAYIEEAVGISTRSAWREFSASTAFQKSLGEEAMSAFRPNTPEFAHFGRTFAGNAVEFQATESEIDPA